MKEERYLWLGCREGEDTVDTAFGILTSVYRDEAQISELIYHQADGSITRIKQLKYGGVSIEEQLLRRIDIDQLLQIGQKCAQEGSVTLGDFLSPIRLNINLENSSR